jgi:hypothetical protein
MHRLKRLPLLGALALATSCGTPERQPVTRSASTRLEASPTDTVCSLCSQARTRTDSARILYWSFAEHFPEKRAQLIERFGAPLGTNSDTLSYQNDSGGPDSTVTFQYVGFSVSYFVGTGAREFATHVSVTDSNQALPLPVGIGASRSQLEHYFGAPDYEARRGDSVLIQFPATEGGGGENELVFLLVGNAVRRIVWSYFVD